MQEQWKLFDTTSAKTATESTAGRTRYWFISNHGRVKVTNNYNDEVKWPKISPTGGRPGRRYAAISHNNLSAKYIHILVATHFIGPKPDDGQRWVVDHIDENPLNNHVDNLQWLTNRRNIMKGIEARRERGTPYTNDYADRFNELLRAHPRNTRSRYIQEIYASGLNGYTIMREYGYPKHIVYKAIHEYRTNTGKTSYNK